jgi:hypothetical protein
MAPGAIDSTLELLRGVFVGQGARVASGARSYSSTSPFWIA